MNGGTFRSSYVAAALLFAGCGAVYPEMRTPVRPLSLGGAEVNPPDGVFFVFVDHAVIPNKTRDGRELTPDPFARLLVDGREILVTPVEQKTRRPFWQKQRYANYQIDTSKPILLEVWDDNTLNDYPICRELVRNFESIIQEGVREIECDSGARVWLAVDHAHPVLGMGLYYELRGSSGAFVTRVADRSPASRVGLAAGDRILAIAGKPVAKMDALGVRSAINSRIRAGLDLEVVSPLGKFRTVRLEEGPIFPVVTDDIALPQARPTSSVFD